MARQECDYYVPHLTKASGNDDSAKYLDAYSKANSVIIVVWSCTYNSNNFALSMTIPKADISSAYKYYMTGYPYNNEDWCAQVRLSPTQISGIGMYRNSTKQTSTLDFYYD